MSTMAAALEPDTRPLLALMQRNDGKCTFADAVQVLIRQGLSASDARDMIWQLLSDGTVDFTTSRELRLPCTTKKAG